MSSKEKILSMLQESSFAYCNSPISTKKDIIEALEVLAVDLRIERGDIQKAKLNGELEYYSMLMAYLIDKMKEVVKLKHKFNLHIK